jgi:O-antigen/teichoic acid export membrane protein
MISTRIVISIFFSVTEFGYFSFSFTLANAILLLLESFSFLLLPKMVHKLSKTDDKDSYVILSNIQTVFVTLSHGLIHFAIFCVPFLFVFFEEYYDAINIFRLLALTLVLYTNSFGCSNLLMAKSKEKIMGFIAFTVLVINVILVYLTSLYTKDINLSIIGTAFCYLIYSYTLNYKSYKLLDIRSPIKKTLSDTFPPSLFIPYIISIAIVFLEGSNFLFIIPFCLYIIFNIKRLFFSYNFFKKIIFKEIH